MSAPERKKVCPNCRHENVPYLVRCIQCGALLNTSDTMPLVLSDVPLRRLEELSRKTTELPEIQPKGSALVLYLLAHSDALIIQEQDNVILGRYSLDGDSANGNLSKYNAYQLGVSRQHAEICHDGTQFVIKDLGSANGTWLNEHRLPPHTPCPLKNGDILWLGQLAILVYLASPDAL